MNFLTTLWWLNTKIDCWHLVCTECVHTHAHARLHTHKHNTSHPMQNFLYLFNPCHGRVFGVPNACFSKNAHNFKTKHSLKNQLYIILNYIELMTPTDCTYDVICPEGTSYKKIFSFNNYKRKPLKKKIQFCG